MKFATDERSMLLSSMNLTPVVSFPALTSSASLCKSAAVEIWYVSPDVKPDKSDTYIVSPDTEPV